MGTSTFDMFNVLAIKYVSGIDKHRITTSRLNVYNSNWVRMQNKNIFCSLKALYLWLLTLVCGL